jgi:hypothetical protein
MLTKNIETMKAEVAAHIAADAVIQGTYWKEGRGCFIGCLTHSVKAEAVTDKFGMPLSLVKIAEHIFESLPAADAKAFFAAVPEAIGADGKDLSRVHWLFLADTLRHLPPQTDDLKAAIDRVIDGMDRLSTGEDWPDAFAAADAAKAAYYAADAADAAAYAAYAASANYATHAVRAAAYAAEAADDARAEVTRQRDVFLRLLREAK